MLVGVRGQNPTFNIFLIFIDNVLNSNVVLGLKNDQVSVSEKKKNIPLMLIGISSLFNLQNFRGKNLYEEI